MGWWTCVHPQYFDDTVVDAILAVGISSCWLGLSGAAFVLNHHALRGGSSLLGGLVYLLSVGDACACLLHMAVHILILVKHDQKVACVWLRDAYTAAVRYVFVMTVALGGRIAWTICVPRETRQRIARSVPGGACAGSAALLGSAIAFSVISAMVPFVLPAVVRYEDQSLKLSDVGWCELLYPWNFVTWTVPALISFAAMVAMYLVVIASLCVARWQVRRTGCRVTMSQRFALVLLAFLAAWFPEVVVGIVDFAFNCSLPGLVILSVFFQTLQGFFNSMIYIVAVRTLTPLGLLLIALELVFAPFLLVPVQIYCLGRGAAAAIRNGVKLVQRRWNTENDAVLEWRDNLNDSLVASGPLRVDEFSDGESATDSASEGSDSDGDGDGNDSDGDWDLAYATPGRRPLARRSSARSGNVPRVADFSALEDDEHSLLRN